MAKDTDKLIRQLSLISFLMAERRPVTGVEIMQEVEGYAGMSDDAFARRFYADRAELESLGIELDVASAGDGQHEGESYTLPPENFYLPAIEFSDAELGALRTALWELRDFAYAEPLRLALQQLSWGKPSPLDAPENRTVALAITGAPGGRELSQRLSKIETAIFRRKTIVFDYYTMGRDAEERRKVDPYHLLFRGGQYYVIGRSHERDAVREFRLSRIRGKVGYSSKSEHDFNRPEDFDPRPYVKRTEWQLSDPLGTARVWISERKAWLVERHYPDAGALTAASEVDDAPGDGVVLETEYGDSRQIVSWVLGLGEHAAILGPPDLAAEARDRLELIVERHREPLDTAPAKKRRPAPVEEDTGGRGESPIRPERFARLVTLAGILIQAARDGAKLDVRELRDTLHVSEEELRGDLDVLNVVNFGGGSYVLYAEMQNGQIEVDPEPYGDNFAEPARLLPLEAKALVAAIDLIGEHLPELASAREKLVDALGNDPATDGLQITTAAGDDSEIARVVSGAIEDSRLLAIEYYKENEDEFSDRTIEPHHLMNGQEGWYVVAWDPARDRRSTFRLDRIKSATVLDDSFEPRPGMEPELEGWPKTGELAGAEVARVWISPERARWAHEDRSVVEELRDGAVIAELRYGSAEWLAREILKECGDFAVLEPSEARTRVLDAAEAVMGAVTG